MRTLLGLFILLVSSASFAELIFDIDGPGGLHPPRGELRAFDWAVDNTLALGVVGTPAGTPFQVIAQFELSDVLFSDGSEALPIGPAGPFEITTLIEINAEVAQRLGTFVSYSFTGGEMNVYFDDLSGAASDNANAITSNQGNRFGAYENGTLILSADVVPEAIAANFTQTDPGPEPLDQFGADEAGVLTVLGFGATDFVAEVTFSNPDWFTDMVASFIMTIGTFEVPYGSSNPVANGGTVGDFVPDYGGGVNGVVFGSDFSTETDANSDFETRQVPEPQLLLLLGLGLLMLVITHRHRTNHGTSRPC